MDEVNEAVIETIETDKVTIDALAATEESEKNILVQNLEIETVKLQNSETVSAAAEFFYKYQIGYNYSKMTYKFYNLPLPFPIDANSPYIDAKTMELHYGKHMQRYIQQLNGVLLPYKQLHGMTLQQLVTSQNLPQQVSRDVKNYAGGVLNHFFYFEQMIPPAVIMPHDVIRFLERFFGGTSAFMQQFKQVALSVFGSGYAWLVINKQGIPQIVKTANQDNPLSDGMYPLLAIDVWEHAYYLQYQNDRGAYIDNWFKTVNWNKVEERVFNWGRK